MKLSENLPVIVSVTTLPSRIGRLHECIESILSGSVIPDQIVIPLPRYSEREQAFYKVPSDFEESRTPRVRIIPAERDWGPGTKLLGALNALPAQCYLVLVDDDVCYKRQFLEGIVDAQRSDRSSSFSYYTYSAQGLTVGQGCDGFSFWSPNLAGILPFAEKYVRDTKLRFHDDFWISFYLASIGVHVRSLQHRLTGRELIYNDLYIDAASLRFLDGGLARDELEREFFYALLKKVEMPLSTKANLYFSGLTNRFLVAPTQSLTGKVQRIFGDPRKEG